MIISEKLTFLIKTNLCQSIIKIVIVWKQSFLFLIEDIIKTDKHKTQKDNERLSFLENKKNIFLLKIMIMQFKYYKAFFQGS